MILFQEFPGKDPALSQFQFRAERYSNNELYEQLHVQWSPSRFGLGCEISLEQTVQTSHGFSRIFYIQNTTIARLMVFANDAARNEPMHSLNDTEKDFASLCEYHASDVRQWLRPTLRLLDQEAAFAPETCVAWQAMASDWPDTPQARDAVVRLIPSLKDQNAHIRNHAYADLIALGMDGATAIEHFKRDGLTIEQNVRLDEVLNHFRKLPEDRALRHGRDPQFLLDCEYSNDLTVRELAARRLTEALHQDSGVDPHAPEVARFDSIEKARTRLEDAGLIQ